MKSDSMSKLFSSVLNSILKKNIRDKHTIKEVKKEYRMILDRAKDIGKNNMLASAYYLAAYFIAMCRHTGLSPEENLKILEEGIQNSRLTPLMLGNANQYLSEKKMITRRKWAEETQQRKYENDWVVNFIEPYDQYAFGLDYHECGVCKLCRDEGCPELARYLCKLDFMLVEVVGVHLDRTMVLAEGDPKCDFRFRK